MNTQSNISPPQIMGILNVTPDSFSDGGQHNKPDAAIERALQMIEQGASIIDIGGESTRPGAEIVSAQEQLDRVIPVIKGLRKTSAKDTLISIDTTNIEVSRRALDAGANWINDISAGDDARDENSTDEPMLELAAEYNCPIVLMHRKGVSSTMQDAPSYEDVCTEVNDYLLQRAESAQQAGVRKENIILDPGIGFGKLLAHNLQLMSGLDSLVDLGFELLLGASRKTFIGEVTGEDDPSKRMIGTCATTVIGVNAGVSYFRVHDVLENKQAMEMAWAIKSS